MGEGTKKGIGKLKIGLVTSAIVIVVLAGLNIWFYMNKTSLESQLKERWDAYGSELYWHNYYQNAYNDYMATHNHTNSEYDTLTDIVNLQESTIWVNHETISQPPSSYTYWTFSASYAGYILVAVHSSTTDKTYIRVAYSSYGVSYNQKMDIGSSGTAVFPVLPCGSIGVSIGNTNLVNGATETVSVTYYY